MCCNSSGTAKGTGYICQVCESEHVRVIGIPGERFVAAFAGQEHFYMVSGEFGYIKQSHSGRLMYRFLHVPDVRGKKIPKIGFGTWNKIIAEFLYTSDIPIGDYTFYAAIAEHGTYNVIGLDAVTIKLN